MQARRFRGSVSHHAGACAEEQVAAHYERRGHRIVGRRWRGAGGEIDLIARGPSGLVFIEVKASRSHHSAAEQLGPRPIRRLHAAAAEYLAGEPGGQDTESRFDVALLDRSGAIDILENALL